MKTKSQFSDAVLEKIHEERILGVRAGTESKHRVIGIWAGLRPFVEHEAAQLITV
ncbi:MAG: hypothetical protein QY328_15735 [Anaerolineales bacterium]|nr:MAG: hypothetical protein QY328_15735 [Anaerolineales bacterium]